MTGVLLVVAKAPVPGQAKTRLCPPATAAQAADLAAAALLDTLDAVRNTPGVLPVVALTGDLRHAARAAHVRRALADMLVFRQRGATFAQRLANAHSDAAARQPGWPLLQIGMDTPQVTPELLDSALARLADSDAVLGPAADGGWWGLGLRDARHAVALAGVPMSRPDTGARTHAALVGRGLRVTRAPQLSDVDTIEDVSRVARLAPQGRFAIAAEALSAEAVAAEALSANRGAVLAKGGMR